MIIMQRRTSDSAMLLSITDVPKECCSEALLLSIMDIVTNKNLCKEKLLDDINSVEDTDLPLWMVKVTTYNKSVTYIEAYRYLIEKFRIPNMTVHAWYNIITHNLFIEGIVNDYRDTRNSNACW